VGEASPLITHIAVTAAKFMRTRTFLADQVISLRMYTQITGCNVGLSSISSKKSLKELLASIMQRSCFYPIVSGERELFYAAKLRSAFIDIYHTESSF
jgi:hypothetical protein